MPKDFHKPLKMLTMAPSLFSAAHSVYSLISISHYFLIFPSVKKVIV